MNGFIGFILIALFIALLLLGWYFWTQHRAKKLGLPGPNLSSYFFWRKNNNFSSAPGPARGGVVGWMTDKVNAIRHRGGRGGDRAGSGAYEETGLSSVRGGHQDHRGFGPLDPDDAWDARVGHEADTYGPGGLYGEEHEGGPTRHSLNDEGHADGMRNLMPEPYIGGSKAGLDQRYDEEMGRTPRADANPFDDDAAEESHVQTTSTKQVSRSGSTLDERKSMFREEV